MPAARMGLAGSLNRNTATYGSPTWTEITLTRDVQENLTWDEADVTDRASRVRRYAKTLLDADFTVTVRNDLTDAGYDALLTAMYSPTAALDLLILDGPTTEVGAQGIRADFQVMSGSQSQALADGLFREFRLRVSIDTNPPKIAEVTGTATITYTEIT
jgi:hypothetical protein